MKRKRHWLLPVLCIMTCIGSGFGLLISVLSLIDIQLIKFVIQIPSYTSVATNIADAHFSYSLVKILLFSLSIAGAYYMLKLKKRGFFMYVAAQLLLPLISFVFLPYPLFQIFTIVIPEFIFAFAFIALYALHLGSMKGSAKVIVEQEDISPE
jgi:hypothetical protein